MNWDKTRLLNTKLTTDTNLPLFPRRMLNVLGWDVPEYCEYRLKYQIGALDKDQTEYFAILKQKMELSLCWVQDLAMQGKITANMYEATVREFETYGRSIKETSANMQDRYTKLKKQNEEQKNTSAIKF